MLSSSDVPSCPSMAKHAGQLRQFYKETLCFEKKRAFCFLFKFFSAIPFFFTFQILFCFCLCVCFIPTFALFGISGCFIPLWAIQLFSPCQLQTCTSSPYWFSRPIASCGWSKDDTMLPSILVFLCFPGKYQNSCDFSRFRLHAQHRGLVCATCAVEKIRQVEKKGFTCIFLS